MPNVPISQTGSPARYPLASSKEFHGASIRFLAGDEQRFVVRRATTFQWHLNIGELTPTESVQWLQFADSAIRNQTSFPYVDPVTGVSHSNGQIANSTMSIQRTGEASSDITLSVKSEDN